MNRIGIQFLFFPASVAGGADMLQLSCIEKKNKWRGQWNFRRSGPN